VGGGVVVVFVRGGGGRRVMRQVEIQKAERRIEELIVQVAVVEEQVEMLTNEVKKLLAVLAVLSKVTNILTREWEIVKERLTRVEGSRDGK
jgi:transcription antitermination factor NusG